MLQPVLFRTKAQVPLSPPQPGSEPQVVLQDASNLQPSKRSCREAAKISSWIVKGAPRGNPKAAVATRWAQKAQTTITQEICGECSDHDYTTLQQTLLHDKSTFCNGKKGIESYIERNTGTEMLKAMAIRAFTTAVSSWGMGILEAAQKQLM